MCAHAPACAQVLVLFAALSTCDPGNVLDAVKAAKGARLRVSVVGVAAEVHICRVFTKARPSQHSHACALMSAQTPRHKRHCACALGRASSWRHCFFF